MTISPELTGGAGFTYEAGVVATYLASLLLEGEVCGLRGSTTTLVELQRAEFGEPLDDVIVYGVQRSGSPAKLGLQIKSSIVLSSNNAVFKEIIDQCWTTLNNVSFTRGTDRVGLAVGEVATKPYRDVRAITEWARASADAADFFERIETVGSSSKQILVDAFRTHIASANEGVVTNQDIWNLIKHFVILRFEVLGEGAQSSHNAITHLKSGLPIGESVRAGELWKALTVIADNAAGAAGSFNRSTLREALSSDFSFDSDDSIKANVERLAVETDLATDEINISIRGQHVERTALIDKCEEALETSRLIQITGKPGSGKSVLLRRLIERRRDEHPVLLLKSNRLMSGGWAGFAQRHRLSNASPETILREMCIGKNPVLFIDGLDRVQIEHQPVIRDIIATIIGNQAFKNWRIIATIREGLSEHLETWLPPALRNEKLKSVDVGPLNDEEASILAGAIPALSTILFANENVQEISRRPFFINVLSRLVIETEDQPRTEVDLAEMWWRGGGYDGTTPLKLRRRNVLLKLARAGAQKLGRDIPIAGFDTDAVSGLIEDKVIAPKIDGHTVDFVHDIFFEWSFFQKLLGELVTNGEWLSALGETGQPPALDRCVSLLSQYSFERQKNWEEHFEGLVQSDLRTGWQRAWLLAPPSSPLFKYQQEEFTDWIFDDADNRLSKFLNWLQATKTEVNLRILENSDIEEMRDELAFYYSWPADFPTWRKICVWLFGNRAQIPRHLRPDALTVFEIWQNAASNVENYISETIIATAMEWLLDFEDHEKAWRDNMYSGEQFSKLSNDDEKTLANRLRSTIISASSIYPDVARAYLDRLLVNEDARTGTMKTILTLAPNLAKSMPTKLTGVILKDILRELPKAHQDRMLEEDKERREHAKKFPEGSQERELLMPVIGYGGVNSHDWRELSIGRGHQRFYPASPAQQPFQALFDQNHEQAINMVRKMANHAIQAWRELYEIDWERKRQPIPQLIDFPWGSNTFWGGYNEYIAYRGVLAPDALKCGLMAMELWAHDQLANGEALDEILEKILVGQNHIAVLGLATALILATHTVSKVTLPVVTCQRLWYWEIRRTIEIDRPGQQANMIGIDNQHMAEPVLRLNKLGNRSEELRQIAMIITLGEESALRSSFQASVGSFPKNLPFEFEDQREDDAIIAELSERAERFSRLAEPDHYRAQPLADGQVQISVELTKEDQAQVALSIERQSNTNDSFILFQWGEAQLKSKTQTIDLTFEQVLNSAKEMADNLRDTPPDVQDLIDFRPIAVTAIAAWTLYGDEEVEEADLDWASSLLADVQKIPTPSDGLILPDQIFPNDPIKLLPYGFCGCVKRGLDEAKAMESLFHLLVHASDEVHDATLKAVSGICNQRPDLFWNMFCLQLDLAIRNDPVDFHSARTERVALLKRDRQNEAIFNAIERSLSGEFCLPEIPEPWVFAPLPPTGDPKMDEERNKDSFWRSPDVWLDVNNLEKVFEELPLPVFLEDQHFRKDVLDLCERLLDWTITKYSSQEEGHDPDLLSTDLWNWKWGFPRWLGRLSSFLPAEEIEHRFLARLLSAPKEPGSDLLQNFVNHFTNMAVLDSDEFETDYVPLLVKCAAKLEPASWDKRNDRLGDESFSMMKSLTFTAVDFAGGAKRFANKDYSEIEAVIPVIDAVLSACGMMTSTASQWLTLMERSKELYPTDVFLQQTKLLLDQRSATAWRGTRIPGRLSAMIRHHAEREPLTQKRQLEMLTILDHLVDEGDRRSAALQKSELFRSTLSI